MSSGIETLKIAPTAPIEGGFTPLDSQGAAPPAVTEPSTTVLPDVLSRTATTYDALVQSDVSAPKSDVTFARFELESAGDERRISPEEHRAGVIADATCELISRAVLFQPENAAELVRAALDQRRSHVARAQTLAGLHHDRSTAKDSHKSQYQAPIKEARLTFNQRSQDGLAVIRQVQAAQAIGMVAEIHGQPPAPQTEALLELAEEMAGGLALDRHLHTKFLNGRSGQLAQGHIQGKRKLKGLFGDLKLSTQRPITEWDSEGPPLDD